MSLESFIQLKDIGKLPVYELDLSIRAANALNNAQISTLGELLACTEADLLKHRNFGKKSLHEIKQKLGELGMSLGSSVEAATIAPNSLLNPFFLLRSAGAEMRNLGFEVEFRLKPITLKI